MCWCSRGCGFLCAAWIFWVDSALLVLERQSRPVPSWVPELLLWLGHPGLSPCFFGGLLCPGGALHRCVRYPWDCIWFPRGNYGRPEDLAEALSHPDQKRTHKGKRPPHIGRAISPGQYHSFRLWIRFHFFSHAGICGGRSARQLLGPEAWARARGAAKNAEATVDGPSASRPL